jgi:hypothetical protein
MTRRYQIVDRPNRRLTLDPAKLASSLAKEGQLLLPLLDLIELDVMGRATIEAVLLMSAASVAGPKQQGKKADRDIVYHGSQAGRVALKERQLRVSKPRLRRKSSQVRETGEVEIPAYEAMRKDARLANRMLEILIDGVSTRRYEGVLPEMAATVGVSKSQVSRETIEAGERLLKELAERDLSGLELLAIWIDGLELGGHHVNLRGGRRCERDQARPWPSRGGDRERGGGEGVARGAGASRSRPGAAAVVRHRRLEGPAVGDRRDLRSRSAGPAVSEPQAEERGISPAQRSAGAGPVDDARGVQAGCR